MMENITNCDNITNLKQIRLTCGQEIKENEDNLFHEFIAGFYRIEYRKCQDL
jgi:hypothetical protein